MPATPANKTIGEVVGLRAELDGKAALATTDNGGQVLSRRRDPFLGVERVFPNRAEYRVVWAEGSTLYAWGRDFRLRKSTDNGDTWTLKGTTAAPDMGQRLTGSSFFGPFLKLANGNLLSYVSNGVPGAVCRSTDDGATWSQVFAFRDNARALLTTQSWCQDTATGYVYLCEYTTSDQSDVNVYRSTDNGATFGVFATLTVPTVRHFHGCMYDPVSQRVYFAVGDTNAKGGIYRVNAGGTGIEAVVTNDQGPAWGTGGALYPIAFMFFPNAIAWVSDGDGWLYRMDRSQLGQASPVVERVYKTNGPGWGSVRLKSDGSEWLATTSAETGGLALDTLQHFYHVTDEGRRITDVGATAQGDGDNWAHPRPVGQAEAQTDYKPWVMFRNSFVTARLFLGTGTGPLGLPAQMPPRSFERISISQPQVTQTNTYTVAGSFRTGNVALRMWVYSAAITKLAGTGRVKLQVWDVTAGSAVWELDHGTYGTQVTIDPRVLNQQPAEEYVAGPFTLTASRNYEIRLTEYFNASATGTAHIVYGLGV